MPATVRIDIPDTDWTSFRQVFRALADTDTAEQGRRVIDDLNLGLTGYNALTLAFQLLEQAASKVTLELADEIGHERAIAAFKAAGQWD